VKITLEVIPHAQQRYPTLGDWQFDENGDLHVRVSSTGNEYCDALLQLHEMMEAIACKRYGVSEKDVDEFDFAFKGEGEPGDDPMCPYRYPHFFATNLERISSHALDIPWDRYEALLEKIEHGNETENRTAEQKD